MLTPLFRLDEALVLSGPVALKAENRQRVRLEQIRHLAGDLHPIDLRVGERYCFGSLDSVFGEVGVGSHFMGFYRGLELPVPNADPDLDRLLIVFVQQRDIEFVTAPRSAMGHTREGVFRIEIQTSLRGLDRVVALQTTLDQKLPTLLAEQLEDPVDRHPVAVPFVGALPLVASPCSRGV